MKVFAVKVILLLVIQMGSLMNQTSLTVQCSPVDFLVRVGLKIDQWLNARVAIEQATVIIEGARFNKVKSR